MTGNTESKKCFSANNSKLVLIFGVLTQGIRKAAEKHLSSKNEKIIRLFHARLAPVSKPLIAGLLHTAIIANPCSAKPTVNKKIKMGEGGGARFPTLNYLRSYLHDSAHHLLDVLFNRHA